ncbi:VOC family protein [Thalassotalea castellviae]|uniref:VOC family protein n=1 Tax=Thalassotalea castellviae TaxID=3075612 RepID=A0ABU3A5X7_9GAMM|nr:VOC family protein [Thalassotalea sp. W431]MDT0605240.1 VOC family protein [Thalassotalea sp. W431]
MNNQIVWVDIPVTNLDRAIDFYSALLAGEVIKQTYNEFNFGLLPHADTSVSGCLIESPVEHINEFGPLIYFNVEGRIAQAVEVAKRFNVKIIEEKFQMGEHGFRAVIKDTEGNKIALHSSVG